MNQSKLNLHLTLDETNLILTALGDRPYLEVFELIRKIQQQASSQVSAAQEAPADASISREAVPENEQNGKAAKK